MGPVPVLLSPLRDVPPPLCRFSGFLELDFDPELGLEDPDDPDDGRDDPELGLEDPDDGRDDPDVGLEDPDVGLDDDPDVGRDDSPEVNADEGLFLALLPDRLAEDMIEGYERFLYFRFCCCVDERALTYPPSVLSDFFYECDYEQTMCSTVHLHHDQSPLC